MTFQAKSEFKHHGSATKQLVTFRIAEVSLGIELSEVQELIRFQEMTWVPLAPVAVEGLINLRGQIITALDMRRIFGMQSLLNRDILPMNIIIGTEGDAVSLLVDEIFDVVDIPGNASMQPPSHLAPEQRRLLKEVFQMKAGLLLVVDPSRVIASCTGRKGTAGQYCSTASEQRIESNRPETIWHWQMER